MLTQLCPVGLGPPLVELRVKRCRVIGATGAGRRTVVVSTGLIEAVVLGDLPSRQAAALVAHSAVLVREGLTRADLLIGCASAPWRASQATARGVSSWGRRLPFTQAAWRLRAVVVAVAVVQAVQVGQVGLAVTIAAIGVFSYALPVWERRWHGLLVRADHGPPVQSHVGGRTDRRRPDRTCAVVLWELSPSAGRALRGRAGSRA